MSDGSENLDSDFVEELEKADQDMTKKDSFTGMRAKSNELSRLSSMKLEHAALDI